VPSAAALAPTLPTAGASAATGADAIGAGGNVAGGYGNLFTDSLKAASDAQGGSDDMMAKAVTNGSSDLTGVMSAMTEAQLATQLTVALRNKAVESFNDVMRMQL
jgi:flagellar hook-basal body complex protein FliE